jgi:hypothetical protein
MPIDTSDTETWDDEDEAAARAYGSECEAEHGDEVDEHDRVTPRPTLGTPPPPREPTRAKLIESWEDFRGATVEWLEHERRLEAIARGGYDYVERPIVRNWNALDGGRRP